MEVEERRGKDTCDETDDGGRFRFRFRFRFVISRINWGLGIPVAHLPYNFEESFSWGFFFFLAVSLRR